MNIYFLISLTSVLSFGTICSQTNPAKIDTTVNSPINNKKQNAQSTIIEWTWQLPSAVQNTFYKSRYATWFIEKMVSYSSGGKTIYRFYLNNGNLLDGDHHDSFLKTDSLDITDRSTVRSN